MIDPFLPFASHSCSFLCMAKRTAIVVVPAERIEKAILSLRGQRVMLDRDLAELYGVRPIALRQQVKRNLARFPEDFMLRLTSEEAEGLVSQNVIPSRRSLGGSLPYAFTQEGFAQSEGLPPGSGLDCNSHICEN